MSSLADGSLANRGLLPQLDPLRRLPSEYAAWEDVATDLPKLLAAGRVRDRLGDLPMLDPSVLENVRERRRAMLLLSYFGHAYVWGEHPPATSLPASLAVPWATVAEALERPPVLSYASYALDNWRRLDRSGPIALGNLAVLQNFLGGLDEEWFILVHVEIEAKAGPGIAAAMAAATAAAAHDRATLTTALSALGDSLVEVLATLERMPEGCDPYIYFHRVRPYIHGWKDHPAMPDGLVYEGVTAFGGAPQRFRGETGAQSAIVPLLDAALGIRHGDDPLVTYLQEMRLYMPPEHRALIAGLEEHSRVRAVVRDSQRGALREAYNRCVHLLAEFRSLHLAYAARYVANQAQASAANPSTVGTGGTPFMRYLQKHRDETEQHLLYPPDGIGR